VAVVNGYCTTAQLREHLADSSSTLTTALLERAINASSRAIDRHCHRRFWLDTDVATRTYIVDDQLCAYVDDIGSRTGVVVKIGTDGTTFPTTLTVDTDYILEPRNADKYVTTTFDAYAFWQIRMVGAHRLYPYYGHPTLSVTAKHGWSAVPSEVEEACILKAASLFKRKEAPFGVAGFGEFGVVRISRTDSDVVELLGTYVIPVV
jgi:hypothetical protein